MPENETAGNWQKSRALSKREQWVIHHLLFKTKQNQTKPKQGFGSLGMEIAGGRQTQQKEICHTAAIHATGLLIFTRLQKLIRHINGKKVNHMMMAKYNSMMSNPRDLYSVK